MLGDHVYECSFFDGSNWSGWQSDTNIGGLSDPTVTSWGENLVELFAVNGGELEFASYDGRDWAGPYIISDEDTPRFVGKPAVINNSDGRTDIFIRGVDGQYYYTHGDGEDWSNWSCHGGNFSSPPEIISLQSNASQCL